MATLTTSWKTYATASFTGGSATIKFYLEAKYSSQSTANNTTNVQTRLRSAFTSGNSMAGAGYKFTCTYANTVSGSGVWTFENEVITSGSSTITHNNDGTKSISLSASAYNKYWNFTKNLSATVSLPKINRIATMKSGTNFNDEGNPTITFNNPAGMNIRPYLNFYDNSNTRVYRQYGTLGSLTSPYTWSLTSEQRTAILNACNKQNTYKVAEGIQSFNGSTLIVDSADSIDKTFTIVNANPTITTIIKETNADVINLLGTDNAQTIIMNVSSIEATPSVTVKKGATVSKVSFSGAISGETTTSPYTFTSNVGTTSANYIKATLTDSRGLQASTDIYSNYISYQKVKQNSFSFKRVNPTSSNVRLQVDSVYYQQTFGTTDNVPTVRYKIGEEGTWVTIPNKITVDGEEVDNPAITKDLENNKLKVDYTIINAINYRDSDTFYIEVSDLLSSWTNKSKVSKGIPVFEFGDDEVQVNGDLLLADINRENVINVRDALGGGGGTTDYSLLTNKPQINGVTLSGNKTTSDLGITIPTALSDLTADSTHRLVTDTEKTTWNNKSNFSGSYNDLTNKPTIPTKTSDLTNDSGYISGITSSDVTTALGYTPQEEIDIIDITSWTNNKMADVYNHSQRGELFRLKISLPDNIYYYEPMNFINESGKSVFDYIDENDNIKHIEITYSGSGNPTKTETTIEIQERITNSNKLDYSLIDNTPIIGNAKIYYGVCDTGSFTGTKQVTISDFVLESGATVIIKFTYGNDYTNTPLLQINNETAKYMKIGSNTLTYKWGANAVLTFVYDGTDFILIEPQKATSSIYGLTTLTDSVSSTSTTSSATPNSVKQAYDLADSKQDTLVSGTNIKTINNTSLLGSGNITIGGGGTATDVQINGTSITSGGTANILTNGTYSSSNKIATMSDIPTVPSNVSSFTNDAGYITSSDLPQDSGWITITPTNGTAGTGYYVPQYRKIGKLVTMRGYITVKNTTAMFNLPTAYRPSARLTFVGTNDNRNVNEIRITEGGDVRLLGTTGNLSSGVPCFLDNVSYFVD